MYALVALGYTMVYGIINLINFAHGEVLMVGALTSWTVVDRRMAGLGLPGWLLLLIVAGRRDRRLLGRSTSRSRRSPTGRCATRRGWRR